MASSREAGRPVEPAAAPEDDWITLARVEKTQGRKGELAARSLTDIPSRFESLASAGATVRLATPGRSALVHLRRAWPHQGRVVLGFDEVPDMTAAEGWIGAAVQVPPQARAEAPAGTYFVDDLVGCAVFDGERCIGTIAAVEPVAGAAPLLHVTAPAGEECLIPFVEAYAPEVLLSERRVRLHLPPGLADLSDGPE